MVVACNAKGQVLVHAVVKRTGEEARKLHPSNFGDSPKTCAISMVEVSKTLGEFLGYDNLLVGWNMDADLKALHLAIPAIQLVEMAREPMLRASVEGAMKNAGIRLYPNAIRCQLPKLVGAITGEKLKLRMSKTDIRDPLVDAWAIAALWRHFGPDIVHDRACTLSWNLPASHTWVGMANLLECVSSTPSKQFLGLGLNLISGGTEIIGPRIEIFNRIEVENSPQTELGAYKLAKVANEQFENLCLGKLPMLDTEVGKLGKNQGTPRPMHLRVQNVGDYDVACLQADGLEQEIWAATDMAEDLPSSCVFYLGGGEDRKNLPPVIVDMRRQPESESEPDDAERNKWAVDLRELQAAVAKNSAHWPITAIAWNPPTALPLTPTPSKSRA